MIRYLLFSFLALFLTKIPPFYFLPFESKFFSTHTLAKLIILVTSAVFALLNSSYLKKFVLKEKILFTLLTLYFLSQSLSIINATDVILFWKYYHNIIISLLIYIFIFLLIRIKQNYYSRIHKLIIITGLMVVLLEFIYFVFSERLLYIFRLVLQKEVLDTYLTDLARGRYSLELTTEIFLPFFLFSTFLYTSKSNYRNKIVMMLASLSLIFLSILSNFRSRVLMTLFSFIAFFVLFMIKKSEHRLKFSNLNYVAFIIAVLLVVFLALSTSRQLFKFDVVNRFFMEDQYADLGTVNARLTATYKSVDIFKSSPLLGVGLGQYALYNPVSAKFGFYLITDKYKLNYQEYAALSPHNTFFQILSETGIFGIVAYSLLILYFVIVDLKRIIISKFNLTHAYIISFWTIFIYTLFNPATTIFKIGWFWFLRGLIDGIKLKNENINPA